MKENNWLSWNTNIKLAMVTSTPNKCGLNDFKKVTASPVTKRSHIP
jgi:hypothetical protein